MNAQVPPSFCAWAMTCRVSVVLPGPVDLDDAAARQTADAEGEIEHQRTGRDRFDRIDSAIAHAHYGAFAELFFDLAECGGERLALVVVHCRFLERD